MNQCACDNVTDVMDTNVSIRDEASRLDVGVLIGVGAISGFAFAAMLPESLRIALWGLGGGTGLVLMFYNALFGIWLVQVVRRVTRRDYAWPTGWPFAARVLDGVARSWGIVLAVVAARAIGDALAHLGAPSPNGSYIADAFFFVLVMLVLATPGLAALWLARRVG